MARAQELGVRVMLQGHGGDELFWGYDWHQRATQESMLRSELSSRSWLSLPNYFRFERAASSNPLKAKIKSIYSGWRRFQSHRHSAANRMIFYDVLPDFDMAQTNTPAMYSKSFSEELGESCPTALFEFDPTSGMPLEITATRLICETYLRENGITQSDRLGMASSVEVRLPLLDYKLVEAVVGLRKAHSDLNLPPKAWLKDAVRHILPESILNRPKRGFNPPVMDWHNALFARYGESLNDGYLVQQRVLTPEIAKRFSRGDFPDDAIVPLSFKALVLEQWCQKMSAICSIEHLQATAVH
jgi:asparagine synthase (glutamine-hydrolysing)